ncbi:katanin p60 ATPase-containing subunit A-like 2 [Uranotaenia lowii]|uniref:katanin p60 ATPase-containing subunit A-like 2 n=1 Tax=Uranotaenia lowii TaxID=190385 RepID=UPI0024799872|nr:katanin p60 ATPase-containing subunit A-like 2 [Uranotaenia lowii]
MSFELDKRSIYERRRNILYLISNYLSLMGLEQSRQALLDETRLTDEFEICDNIDLDTIYQEYSSYYLLKFGKLPRVVKKNESLSSQSTATISAQRRPSGGRKRSQAPAARIQPQPQITSRAEPEPEALSFNLMVSQLGKPEPQLPSPSKSCSMLTQSSANSSEANGVSPSNHPVENGAAQNAAVNLKPLLRLHEHFSSEWKELADIVCRDLIKKDLNHRWHQIKGQNTAIKLLQESVLTPLKYPELFVGLAKPWRCILLHGPPGTGKTMLARTLCSESRESITFFNATASTLISKWRGESEKLVRVLYDVARFYAPSIIFIDEFDGLASRRDSIGEHEASKRFKNEFLSLIDGLDQGGCEEERVFLLGSTNIPWDIDAAFLRRFEKKILIDVPDAEGRREIINDLLPISCVWDTRQMEELIKMTENFTGDEIRVACKEASMMKIREKIEQSSLQQNKSTSISQDVGFEQLQKALELQQPASCNLIEKHREWNRKFGNQS